mgnify:CR=1 FL=1
MLNISLIVLFKFLLGIVVGLYLAETYDYSFTDFINQIEKVFAHE